MARVRSLDGLRGVAAFIVVLHHCALAIPGLNDLALNSYVLRPLVAGKAAVDIFFVLSGFVLYLMLHETDGFRYRPYVIRRFVRIYPPYMFAILLAVALVLLIHPRPVVGLTSWFNDTSWNVPLSGALVLGHLLMVTHHPYTVLDNVVWSLSYEMRLSLGYPFIAFLTRKSLPGAMAGLLLVWVAALGVKTGLHLGEQYDFVSVAHYSVLFAVGAAICIHGDRVRAFFDGRGKRLILPLLGVAIVLLGAPITPGVTDVGAIVMVALAFGAAPVERLLARPLLTWLGRISYTLYLTHLLVLLTVFHLLAGRVPAGWLIAAVPVLAVLVAEAVNRLVEQPLVRLGRRWGRARASVSKAGPASAFPL